MTEVAEVRVADGEGALRWECVSTATVEWSTNWDDVLESTRVLHSAQTEEALFDELAKVRLDHDKLVEEERDARWGPAPKPRTLGFGPVRRLVLLAERDFEEVDLEKSAAWREHLDVLRVEAEREAAEASVRAEKSKAWQEKNDRETYLRLKARFEPAVEAEGRTDA